MTSSTPGQRIGIYLRVSTLNQETENQLLQLRVLCEQQGWRVTKEYVDVESGRKGKRERSDFAQLFKDAAWLRQVILDDLGSGYDDSLQGRRSCCF